MDQDLGSAQNWKCQSEKFPATSVSRIPSVSTFISVITSVLCATMQLYMPAGHGACDPPKVDDDQVHTFKSLLILHGQFSITRPV